MTTNVHCKEGEMSLEVTINGEKLVLNTDESVTMESIVRKVANEYGLTIEDLKGLNRCRNISRPRQVAMYLIREYFGKQRSYQQIGNVFRGRNHATVMHACELISRLVEQEADLKDEVERLKLIIDFDSRPSVSQVVV